MNTKKSIFSVWTSILLAFFLLSGCASVPSKKAEAKTGTEKSKINSLAEWKGEWQSFDTVSGATKLDEAYRLAAGEKPFYTPEGFKATVQDMYRTPIAKAKFDGSNVVVFTVVASDGTEKTIPCEYKHVGQMPVEGFDGHFWEAFEAVKTVRGLSKAKYMLAFSPHQHGKDGLLHWHARFGGSSFEDILHGSGWPTYVSSDMDGDELVAEFSKTIAAVAGMFPDSPLAPYEGKWINSSLIYDDKRPAVQAVYKKLIAEFAGKNPKGGDFTQDEIVAFMKQTYGTDEDFTHLEFVADGSVNDMIVWKNGKKIARIPYKRDRAVKGTLISFTAQDMTEAGDFAYLTATNPHGVPSHFHFWYGSSIDELSEISTKPTCIPVDTPEEQVAMRVEKSCRKILSGIVK